jgi:hypothetical protein
LSYTNPEPVNELFAASERGETFTTETFTLSNKFGMDESQYDGGG